MTSTWSNQLTATSASMSDCFELLVPERYQRINFCRATCRNRSREQPNQSKQRRHGRERHPVSCADAEQQRLHHTRNTYCAKQPETDADQGQDQSLADDQ